MESEKFDTLLEQVTRMADAMHLQSELQLKALEKGGRPDSSCKDLIQATNRMGRSLNQISSGVDRVNAGRMQDISSTVGAVSAVEVAGAASAAELDTVLGTLDSRVSKTEAVVNDIISHLAPHNRGRGAMPLDRLEALMKIETGAAEGGE